MNRVAVTGFGVVSPIGIGQAAFWRSLRNGRSGVGRITRFDCLKHSRTDTLGQRGRCDKEGPYSPNEDG